MRGFMVVDSVHAVFLMGILSIAHGQSTNTNANVKNGSHVSALYVLGDSSVDCGDNTLFYPLLHARLSLYPCNGSDATLLPHLLDLILIDVKGITVTFVTAEKIGLTSIRPFYGQNGSLEEVLGGLNFGSTQATIMNQGSYSHQSLNQQLRQVSETMQLLQLQLSDDTALQFIKSSIFFLSFGKEDYMELFLHNSSSSNQMFRQNSKNFATILVNQVENAARYLYNANARKIICLGILPLGCTPRMVWELNSTPAGDYNANGCVEHVNDLVFEYNRLLDEQIAKLNTEFSDAQIVFCDVYNGMMKIINEPRLYGFEDVKNACCGLGLNGAVIGCVSKDMACDHASTHVWWDLFNPTPAVNEILADAAWSGLPIPDICHPITVHELVNMTV